MRILSMHQVKHSFRESLIGIEFKVFWIVLNSKDFTTGESGVNGLFRNVTGQIYIF